MTNDILNRCDVWDHLWSLVMLYQGKSDNDLVKFEEAIWAITSKDRCEECEDPCIPFW